jgi:hypothetical protein
LNIEGGIYPYVISGGWGKRLIKIDDTNYFTLDLEQQNSYPYTPDGGGGAYNISPSDFPYE